jgi:hypothetical protein
MFFMRGRWQMRLFTKVGMATAIAACSLAVAEPAFATVVNVGGGTWNYGTSYSFPTTKNVWSHYVHPSLYHSATAICGSNNVKIYNTANNWANADTHCNVSQSSAAYWNTY